MTELRSNLLTQTEMERNQGLTEPRSEFGIMTNDNAQLYGFFQQDLDRENVRVGKMHFIHMNM